MSPENCLEIKPFTKTAEVVFFLSFLQTRLNVHENVFTLCMRFVKEELNQSKDVFTSLAQFLLFFSKQVCLGRK